MTTNGAPRWRKALGAVLVAGAMVGADASAAPSDARSERANEPRYIVKFRAGAAEEGKRDLQSSGARIVLELTPQTAVAALISSGSMRELSGNPNIEFIEPDAKRYPLAQADPYGVAMVQADQVSVPEPGNRTIGIIDSGLYRGHEDLPSNITGADNAGTGSWMTDSCGHGTHVAGTIAAVNNELGVVGVDPGVNLHIVKVFGDDCQWAYASSLVDALNTMLDPNDGVDVNIVSMSLGGAVKSRVEDKAFASAYDQGVLLAAAAGNGGNRTTSYPAGYKSVISVAAIDATKVKADFSQVNRDVELAAPGVDVLSTIPWAGTHTLSVGGTTWSGNAIDGSAPTAGTSGLLVDGGLCTTSGSWADNVVLCQRGDITFAEKVSNVTSGGGVAAVIYNNVSGGFSGTLNGTSTIPAIALSQEDGTAALDTVGAPGTVVNQVIKPGSGYEAWSGTSMATPHVSAVAALVWSCNRSWSNTDIRNALNAGAEDLGAAGRDTSYGYGLVRAKAALDKLPGPNACSSP